METVWTQERSNIAARLWNEGKSASQIAEHLGNGISRNSVISKVRRLNLPMRAVSKPQAIAAPKKKRSPITLPLPPGNIDAVLKPSPLPPEENIVTPWNMLNIGPRQCRYPYGSGAETSLCGEPAAKGPYCSIHAAKCLVPAKKQEAAE